MITKNLSMTEMGEFLNHFDGFASVCTPRQIPAVSPARIIKWHCFELSATAKLTAKLTAKYLL